MSDDNIFTDEEYRELFVDVEPLTEQRRRRVPAWLSVLGVLLAVAMLAGYFGDLVTGIQTSPSIREPADIRAFALDEIASSPWGWLASDVVVRDLEEPRVGAYVTNAPPDGIITVDLRPWNEDRLDELIDHELGHLVDFAVWGLRGDSPEGRRGGLRSEAWAECSAVGAGTRRVDQRDPDTEYHCFANEFEVWEQTMSAIDEICRPWGPPECRPVTLN